MRILYEAWTLLTFTSLVLARGHKLSLGFITFALPLTKANLNVNRAGLFSYWVISSFPSKHSVELKQGFLPNGKLTINICDKGRPQHRRKIEESLQ